MSNGDRLQDVLSAYSHQRQSVHVQELNGNGNSNNNFNDFEFEGQEKQGATFQSIHRRNIKSIPGLLPNRSVMGDEDIIQEQFERNNQKNKVRTKLVQPKVNNQQNISANQRQKVIKIYDLNEQENNQIIVRTNIQQHQNIEVTNNQLFANQNTNKKEEKEEPNIILYNELKQQIQSPGLAQNKRIQTSNSEVMNEGDNIRSNSSRYIRQKLEGMQHKLVKGLFYEKQEQKQDYKIGHVESKTSLDSGLQVINQMSSRDQLSTRHMLVEAASLQKNNRKKVKRLPSLIPYREIAQQSKHYVKLPFSKIVPKTDNKEVFSNFRFGKFVIRSEEIMDVYDFVRKPIPVGKMVECNLIRNKNCCKLCYIDYDLLTIDSKFLLSTKKMAFKCNSTYNISLMSGYYGEGDDYYLGKVEGNFMGSKFNIYAVNANTKQREIVATVCYHAKCFCAENKFRQIQIYLKKQTCRYDQLEGFDRENNLRDLFQIGDNKSMAKIRKFINKPPKWNPHTEVYSQDFHGKLRVASVKNMIIIDEANPQDYLLLVAKQADNQFAFDICHPFSPFVALGILATSFDFKLATQ